MLAAQEGIIIQKTPAGDWDVTIDWSCPSRNLGADEIEISNWTLGGPNNSLVLDEASINAAMTMTTIWISAGTTGAFYTVTNTITTSGGRVMTGTFLVQIVDYVFLTQPHFV